MRTEISCSELITNQWDLRLPSGTENSLTSTVEAAAAALDQDNVNAGTNKLEAFLYEVDAQRGEQIIEAAALSEKSYTCAKVMGSVSAYCS